MSASSLNPTAPIAYGRQYIPERGKNFNPWPAKPEQEAGIPATWKAPVLAKTTITVEFKQDGKVRTVAHCKSLEEAEQLALELGTGHYVRITHTYRDKP